MRSSTYIWEVGVLVWLLVVVVVSQYITMKTNDDKPELSNFFPRSPSLNLKSYSTLWMVKMFYFHKISLSKNKIWKLVMDGIRPNVWGQFIFFLIGGGDVRQGWGDKLLCDQQNILSSHQLVLLGPVPCILLISLRINKLLTICIFQEFRWKSDEGWVCSVMFR